MADMGWDGVVATPGFVRDSTTKGRTYTPVTLPGTQALEFANYVATYAAPGPTTSLMIGSKFAIVSEGGAISGAGHAIGGYFGAYTNCPATTLSLVIGGQNTLEHTAGTITLGCGGASTMNLNTGTFTEFCAHLGQITSNGGTVTKGCAYSGRLTGNSGTVTEWNAFHVPATSRTGLTKGRSFKNEDTAMPLVTLSPVCDGSFAISAPVAAGTTILNSTNAAGGFPVSTYVLNPAGTIATHTLTFPTAAMGNALDDGQEVLVFTTQTVTALSFTAGPTLYGAPSTLLANAWFRMKYFSALAGWVRVG